jgi:mono/diheme cytochrome c family protein
VTGVRISSWLGILLVLGGLAIGSAMAGGINIAPAARVRPTPAPLGPVAVPSPLALQANPGDPERGRAAYAKTCAQCHGSTGNGSPPLHGSVLSAYYRDDSTLAGLIRQGFGSMPGTPASQLPDQDVADVIALIRTFP